MDRAECYCRSAAAAVVVAVGIVVVVAVPSSWVVADVAVVAFASCWGPSLEPQCPSVEVVLAYPIAVLNIGTRKV